MTGDYVTRSEFNAAVMLLATGNDLRQVEDRMQQVEVRLSEVDGRLLEIDGRLSRADDIVEKLEIRLEKVEVRLEKVEIRLERVELRLDALSVKIDTKVDELKHYFELTADRFRDECKVLHDGYRAQSEKHDALMREFRVHEEQQHARFERVEANLYLLNQRADLKLPDSFA